ncbi:radical SAM/SPASM family putative metalloenzyme maturase [uncultured Pseudodesulfovibrio sp.]|uniref:radical SAM/SPASM family putative metalloenzyme maturase n=1 Tax=uncultured Pseudodesulfovibrio sp. TaxID=2035858 RepID=UPI0029C64491|nr:radical SAM/SPASM family putative metalloenzyme maturase [uncultured Pseudodesulfovibrio sp.]
MNRPQTFSAPAAPKPEPSFPLRIQVEVTTRCNMRCAMCVKTAPDSFIPETDLDLEAFTRLGPALARCEALVLNGIGEPLLNPDLAAMAAFARKTMPESGWIGFQTNGLLVTEALAHSLVEAGVDTFCVSVDTLEMGGQGAPGGSGELHGRTGAARLERAFRLLREAGERYGRTLRLGVECVFMRDTAEQLPLVIRWAGELGLDFAVVSHVMPYDQAMQDQSLFNPNTPEATALFDKWQATALSEGLDLHDQHGVAWKFVKSDREKRLHALVKGLLGEAEATGVWVHLPRLLEWDSRNREETGRTPVRLFRQAEDIARLAGLELRLPPLQALDERHCHFVEDGTAFVTSRGDVSPCQFLWHQYACHLDGGKKVVRPWLFGNIREHDLVDIWQGAAYADFRRQVLEYDYPYCSNCPFVPCDDIKGAPFDFDCDCLGATIPCGHCLWCMGGLQCLL